MNDNLDDFLSSLGIAPTTNETVETSNENLPAAEQPAPEVQELQSLTNSDIDDILSQNGFSEAMFDDAQEMAEEESGNEEEEENTVSAFDAGIIPQETPVRDLDAEEDADWQEAIDSGGISLACNYVGDGELQQDGDMRVDPSTGEVQVMTGGTVLSVGNTATEDNLVVASPGIADDGITTTTPSVTSEPIEEANNDTTLPKNSPTLLLDDTTSRFSGAEWYNEIQKKRIIVAGIGGIGSWLSFQLARMHPEAIFMYDEDTVELANMSGQLYSRRDAGRTKVSAIYDTIQRYTSNSHVYAIGDRYTSNSDVTNIMMCGFDNMEARKIFFNKWLTNVETKPLEEQKKCLFLDGRLSIDTLQVLCIVGDDKYNIDRYRNEFLFSDAEADETVCSMKQTTYMACMIGSIMVNLFTNWVADSLDPIIPYDLPFFTEYDAQNMIFKTMN